MKKADIIVQLLSSDIIEKKYSRLPAGVLNYQSLPHAMHIVFHASILMTVDCLIFYPVMFALR